MDCLNFHSINMSRQIKLFQDPHDTKKYFTITNITINISINITFNITINVSITINNKTSITTIVINISIKASTLLKTPVQAVLGDELALGSANQACSQNISLLNVY